MKKSVIAIIIAALVCVGGGYAISRNSQSVDSSNVTTVDKQYNEVVIRNDKDGNKRELKFTEVPKKAISFNQSTTEMMLTLGLGDKMVGTSYLDDEILPNLKDQYDKIEVLSDKYPSLEVVLSKNPDFLIGWPSAFSEKNIASYKTWDEKGVKAYIPNSLLKKEQQKIEDGYNDILDLGKIFNVEDKANEVVNGMKKKVEDVQAVVSKETNKPKVAIIDDYEDGQLSTMSGDTLESNLIELAGGENVLKDFKGYEISIEDFVVKQPEVIVLNDYKGGTPIEERIKNIKENKVLSQVPAVKNNRFVVIPLGETMIGVRNADGVVRLAKGFYPDKF